MYFKFHYSLTTNYSVQCSDIHKYIDNISYTDLFLDLHFVKQFLLFCNVCQYPNLLPKQEVS